MKLKTNTDALTMALYLAITATTEAKANECIQYAETIAQGMTAKQVNICKMAAECAVEYEAQHAA
tara:strand:- start:194 stop:388 length:195 start_codon:yes stop_codon:yes gene_type:complete